MKKYLEILKRCPLFHTIAEPDLLAMLSCLGATVHPYEKNEPILTEGDAAPVWGFYSLELHKLFELIFMAIAALLQHFPRRNCSEKRLPVRNCLPFQSMYKQRAPVPCCGWTYNGYCGLVKLPVPSTIK